MYKRQASLALDEPLGITAVAGIIQHNTSGILSRKGDGIDKPAGLTGKTYSTWDSPIELAMLENVVNGDEMCIRDRAQIQCQEHRHQKQSLRHVRNIL